MKTFLFATLLGVAAAGTVELSTGDLTGRNPSLDNIKGSWSQALKFLGRDATLSAEYDRNANKDFVNEATLSGSLDRLKYALTTSFDGDAELTLETSTDDGTVLEAETVLKGFAGGPRLTKVTASRSATVQGQDCDLEISHDIGASESKLKLSTVLGSGITAIGSLSSKGGDSSLSCARPHRVAARPTRPPDIHPRPISSSTCTSRLRAAPPRILSPARFKQTSSSTTLS